MWVKPHELPDTNTWMVFALDTETVDPKLQESGPGFVYDEARVIGISVASDTGFVAYYPIGHESGNYDGPVVQWLQALVNRPEVTMATANGRYDLEGLWSLGVDVKCKVVDIQVNDALLDENNSGYSLDRIAKRYGFEGKNSAEMEQQLIKQGYVDRGKADYTKLHKLDPVFVGPYAEYDAKLTLDCYLHQLPKITEEGLDEVAGIESELTKILFRMRINGVCVDVSKAEQENSRLFKYGAELLADIRSATTPVEPFSSQSLETWLNSFGLVPPRTTKDNPSVSNEWLAAQDNELCRKMAEYRRMEKIRRDFIQGMVIEGSYKGRLHPQWFQTRGSSFMSGDDVHGTRSGRIACVNPNLSQIPARHPVYGPIVRSLFIPEPGKRWLKADYSSQEPRILLHYAVQLSLSGASDIQELYIRDPGTDYHQVITDIVNKVRSSPITRKQGKDINLGLAYGMGKKKMAGRLGLSMNQSNEIIETYHRAGPFMKSLQYRCMDVAQKRGFVRTITGRKRRFNEYENADWNAAWEKPVKSEKEAQEKWVKYRRANTHKALNSIVQGSAAEQTKKAIIQAYNEGYLPILQNYDEICFSVVNIQEAKRLKEIMETSISFCVPHLVDAAMGPSWGEQEEKVE